jgi:O-antigen/teichoic acid export membrane protein
MNGLARAGVGAEDRFVWRRFSSNLSVSLAGALLSLLIKLGQTLLLMRALRIDDYGRVLVVINLFAFLNSFIGLRVSDVMFRFYQPLREGQEERALQGLLLLCLGVSLAVGLLIFCGVLVLSPWLSESLYESPGLAPLFALYGCTVLFTTLGDVSGPILRMHGRFTALVVPQVLGGLATLLLIAAHTAAATRYSLSAVVAAFAVGAVIQAVPPLVQALRLVRPYLAGVNPTLAARALAPHRPELTRCLFNSNLSGYLQVASTPGDVFLMGIFCSPAQVALYGLAKQLIAPIALLLTNVQFALTPEVALIIAGRKLRQLKRLISGYFALALVAGGVLLACTLLAGRFLLLRFSRPEYAEALPVFYILATAAWVLLICAVLRPLALSLDLLKWENLAQLATVVALVALILSGRLDAMTLAFVQLAGALPLRFLFSVPVWTRLRALTSDERLEGEP